MYSEMTFQNNVLVIKGVLYNGLWFKYFGTIQHEILECRGKEILVDLRNCVFISPTPFLSLLLTLVRAKEENNCTISICLGVGDSADKRKFLNYCAREGFLDIINGISNISYDIQEYIDYNVIGNKNYENVLKARIVNLSRYRCDVENIVNTLIDEINESKLNVSENQRLYMVVAIRNILQELIDNVDKHAYDEGNKYYALYIRIRYATDTTIRIGDENNRYGKNVPTTKPHEVYIHKAIEVYFQDIGKGIVKSYEEKGKKYSTRPLREIVNYTFFREKFENRPGNTSINGLAFLRKILEEKNNYFSVYNHFEGTGAFGISDGKMNLNNIQMRDFCGKNDVQGIIGQIYNFTLFDREYLNDIYNENYEKLIEVYREKYVELNEFVIDLRKKEKPKSVNSKEVFLFMPPYMTKIAIINKLRLVFQTNSEIETLIISDIKDEELVLYDWAIGETYINTFELNAHNKVLSVEKIFIITDSLKIRSFKVEKNKLVRKIISFVDFESKHSYLYRLKIYESKELARVLSTNLIGKYILTKGNIKWTDEQEFKGFINFDMLAANDRCFDILQRNLKRVVPLIGNKRLYAIDTMVERLVDLVNCLNNNMHKEYFGVGSVFVSGTTLQSSDYQGNTIHFFNRGIGERKPALFFDPVYLYTKIEPEDEEITYVRIGKSPRIRRKDFKPSIGSTNSYLDENDMYKILHQYAYSSILCGHLNFEKRHDLLSINLSAIMYDESTRLKEFVEGVINYSLGHYINKEIEDSEYFDSLRNTCLIIYPYNQFTSSIFKGCSIEEEYFQYIVGLTPTNITSSGEDLEYSECFTEYITAFIEKYKHTNPNMRVKIVVFDTLSYSGRTKQEIFEYINSIENVEPFFVSVVDAKVNHYPKRNNMFNYMNINIPLLGRSDTCKMCIVLNKLNTFKNSIIDASILATIENIQATWGVRDIRNYKEIIKLRNFERVYAEHIFEYNPALACNEEDLYFVNALPLYIFITNRIKKENDFYTMEFVLDTYAQFIGADSMSYILSLFLLEYGDGIYHSLLRKICSYLLVYLRDSKEVEIRQLLAVAILSVEEKVSNIISTYIQENVNDLHSSFEGQMILMYFLNKEKCKYFSVKTSFLYNKMKSGNDRLDLYKQFHCQLKNTNGNIHNSPLKSLIERQENVENKRLTMASLSLLEHSLNCTELSFDILYEEGRNTSDSVVDEDISIIMEECLNDISTAKKLINENGKMKVIQLKLDEIFRKGQLLHKRLFAPYKIQDTLENRGVTSIDLLIAERVDNYNKNKEGGKYSIVFDESYDALTNISSMNIAAIYYIWNNMLVREIDYVLDNVGKFTNESQTVLIENEKRAGEVKLKISQENLEISVYNNTADCVENIRYKAKQRYQKEVLSLLGVRFEYFQNNDENPVFSKKAIVTKIIIPNIQNRKDR